MKYSNKQNQLLISLYPDNQADKITVSHDVIHYLFKENLIKYTTADFHNNIICLSEKGKAYVEEIIADESEHRFQHFHTWTNTVIASVALIVAIISIVIQATS